MLMPTLPPSLAELFSVFAPCFTAPDLHRPGRRVPRPAPPAHRHRDSHRRRVGRGVAPHQSAPVLLGGPLVGRPGRPDTAGHDRAAADPPDAPIPLASTTAYSNAAAARSSGPPGTMTRPRRAATGPRGATAGSSSACSCTCRSSPTGWCACRCSPACGNPPGPARDARPSVPGTPGPPTAGRPSSSSPASWPSRSAPTTPTGRSTWSATPPTSAAPGAMRPPT